MGRSESDARLELAARWLSSLHAPISLKIRLLVAQLRNQLKLSRKMRRNRGPYRPLIILASARTGSNFLVSCLRSTEHAHSQFEVISNQTDFGVPGLRSRRLALAQMRRSMAAQKGSVRGVKVLLVQLELHDLTLQHLVDAFPEARFILLHRRSLAEQYTSLCVARATGDWVAPEGRGVESFDGQVEIEAEAFRAHCRELREEWQRVESFDWPKGRALWMSYEVLVADPQAVFDEQVFPFLGLASEPVRPDLLKQSRRPLAEQIANWDEIAPLFAEKDAELNLPDGVV